jgi:hypothetical protein
MQEGERAYPVSFDVAMPGVFSGSFRVSGLRLIYENGRRPDSGYSIDVAVWNERSYSSTSITPLLDTPRSDGSRLYFYPSYSFQLMPGENRIRVTARKDGRTETREFVFIGEGFIHRARDVEMVLEGREAERFYRKEMLDEVCGLIADINSMLRPVDRIRDVQVSWNPQAHGAQGGRGVITATSGLFSLGRELALAAFFHEAVHTFEDRMEMRNRTAWRQLEGIYGRMNEALFVVFDESSYFNVREGWGHPTSNPSELFASAATVLRFRPDEFIRKASSLNAQERAVAMEPQGS